MTTNPICCAQHGYFVGKQLESNGGQKYATDLSVRREANLTHTFRVKPTENRQNLRHNEYGEIERAGQALSYDTV